MFIRNNRISILALAFLAVAGVFASCENDINEVKELGKKKTGVEEGYKIESFLSQDGKMKARLTAPVMLRYLRDTARIVFPNTMHVDFYSDSLKIENTLFARYGTYLENDNKVLLQDSVIVINVKGDTLRTEELWWDQNRQLFYTDKPAYIRQPEQKFDGMYGMQADQSFKKWTLFQASGSLKVADSSMAVP
ncbi:LPS export ABC transporter periplasmic protein LptC [Filimonas effusa]|uniref:LPS export ABC transporter periplasmic protein LptC n=1 Tax=Filimonas effusa TaxID=2508721 RepID=A0A4Q1CZU7_9BACT|nr:LPS export ABC transporter periplasmic protein LptC [Filimonas effusa]RXK80937.1 LPS export ABC transporter periplasmic protein LptC [Filimonas effusa]